MICQTCQKNEATIHYFESVNGQSRTMNLCDSCAAQVEVGGLQINVQIGAAPLSPAMDRRSYEQLVARPMGGLACVGCGTTLEEFQVAQSYRCPACRDTFRMATGRGSQEAGKVAELRARLEEAVIKEDFETAAKIRDLLLEAGHV